MSDSALSAADGASDAALPAAVSWRKALLAWSLALLAILVVYRQTALEMATIWIRSETFTHGFLVPPITLWLIWRARGRLARLAPSASYWGLFGVAAAGLTWALGEVATVGVLSQFALVSLLVISVPAILGGAVARRIAFPLAFLFFAVPFGEFALPQLMEWTARFTVFGLRLSGVPVYREGLRFVIPSGSWSVIEACSGVRYLIASLCVGTLYAYLNYQTLRRRLVFIAVSLIVPVFANWLRAYMIVMLGHLSGNTLAVGVDHLIYGWVFFGVVIAAVFWIGARWREDEPPARAADSVSSAQSAAPPAKVRLSPLLAAVGAFALAMLGPITLSRVDTPQPPLDAIAPIAPIAGWAADPAVLADWTPRFTNASAQRALSFQSSSARVGVYLGYYRDQDADRKMVSSVNVLVTSKDPIWARQSQGTLSLELDGRTIDIRTADLRSVESQNLRVWQWYWINGRLTSSDYLAKAYTALSRLTGQGDDSAVIVVYAPAETPAAGDAALRAFVGAAWPAIDDALNRSRGTR
jgi:exosortase A